MNKLKMFTKGIVNSFKDINAIILLIIEFLAVGLFFLIFNKPITVANVLWALFMLIILNGSYLIHFNNNLKEKTEKKLIHSITIISTFFFVIVLASIVKSPIFNAKKYGAILQIETIKAKDIFVGNPQQVRKVNKTMALVKANKILGQKIKGVELNTQFELGHGSVVKYKGKEVWVFPLEYSGMMKWIFNNGIPGYVMVSATDPNAKAVFVHKPFKYSPSAWFMDNIEKVALIKNFLNPVRIHFEIDENGNPYWVVSSLKYKFFGNVFEVSSVNVVDAKTGKVLKNIPSWVDKTLPEDLAEEYVEYYGKYHNNSFWSYLFVGKNVLVPTNYNNREMWLIENKRDQNLKWFTGLTSKNKKDNSLAGAILMDSKSLKAYFVEDASGVTDEKGAIDAINSKLGANSIKWQAVLPMPFIINNKWYWVASIVDKSTSLYQEEGAVEGKNISNVVFGLTLQDIVNTIKGTISNIQGNKTTKAQKKQIILHKINKMEKELKELKELVKTL